MTPRESLANILASAVGAERAEELIDERTRVVLGTATIRSEDDALAVLRSFAQDQDLVGVTARLALRRQQAAPAASAGGNLVPLSTIDAMLEAALGADKARAVVREAAVRVGVAGESCTRAQVIRIFEELAAMPGLVGVTARFAKARYLLRRPAD